MDKLKHQEKDHEISEDEHHRLAGNVQTATDKVVKEIDEALAVKEQEIMQV
jgi:ribosome recycling factor